MIRSNMRHDRRAAVLVLPIVAMLLMACDQAVDVPEGEDTDMRIAVGDTTRRFRVHVPAGVEDGAPVRLILAFHGSHDTGWRMQFGAGLDEATVGTPTVLVYPDAAKGNWAEGCDCNIADRLGIDDIGFVEAMLDTLGARWTLDNDRTFAVGYSQGGMFAHRVACDLSDRFAAIATVAATMSYPLSTTCQPQRPVSAAILHGTEDPILPWEGSGGGSLGVLSATGTAEFWARQSDCDVEPSVDSRDLGDGLAVRTHEYTACYADRHVTLYELVGYGHTWPRGPFEAGETIVKFFSGVVP